eukprot:6078624-Prorocentrum_lima.AAC.1
MKKRTVPAQEPLYGAEDAYQAATQEWGMGEEDGEWEPQEPEGYDDEDAAYDEDNEESDHKDAEE